MALVKHKGHALVFNGSSGCQLSPRCPSTWSSRLCQVFESWSQSPCRHGRSTAYAWPKLWWWCCWRRSLLETSWTLFAFGCPDLFIHHKQAFVQVGVIALKSLWTMLRFAWACGVPNVTVAHFIFDSGHDRFNGINLVRTHHHDFALAFYQHHITTDQTP